MKLVKVSKTMAKKATLLSCVLETANWAQKSTFFVNTSLTSVNEGEVKLVKLAESMAKTVILAYCRFEAASSAQKCTFLLLLYKIAFHHQFDRKQFFCDFDGVPVLKSKNSSVEIDLVFSFRILWTDQKVKIRPSSTREP